MEINRNKKEQGKISLILTCFSFIFIKDFFRQMLGCYILRPLE